LYKKLIFTETKFKGYTQYKLNDNIENRLSVQIFYIESHIVLNLQTGISNLESKILSENVVKILFEIILMITICLY